MFILLISGEPKSGPLLAKLLVTGLSCLCCVFAIVVTKVSKFSMDICLYMGQDFDFISFPNDLLTGSSIMPHKQNPDIFELIRAKSNLIQKKPKLPMWRIDPYETQKSAYEDESMNLSHRSRDPLFYHLS